MMSLSKRVDMLETKKRYWLSKINQQRFCISY